MIEKKHFLTWLRRYVCNTRAPVFNAGVLRIAADYAKVANLEVSPRLVREVFEILRELENVGYLALYSIYCQEGPSEGGLIAVKCGTRGYNPWETHVVIPKHAVGCT